MAGVYNISVEIGRHVTSSVKLLKSGKKKQNKTKQNEMKWKNETKN